MYNPFRVERCCILGNPGCAARPRAMECNRFAVRSMAASTIFLAHSSGSMTAAKTANRIALRPGFRIALVRRWPYNGAMTSTTQSPKPKRRWYQFSLRAEDAMKWPMWMLPIAFLLVVGTPVYSAESDREQEAAIAAIKMLGGGVEVDKSSPSKGVTTVWLSGAEVTDAGLVYLKGMTSLTLLYLDRTKVTDEGLKHVKALTKLETLALHHTQVTDAGLKHLKGLKNLVMAQFQRN